MCDDCRTLPRISRRGVLGASAAFLALRPRPAWAAQAPVDPVELAPGLLVNPRSAWAFDLPDPGALPMEVPGDVRVLLVHHSASRNDYEPAEVVDQIRSFHRLHTSPDKGWPDVAYNFFVDRFGAIWEGRSGSMSGPVIGDATGGNQGFSQLVCMIGDFQVEAPSPEAVDSVTSVLAWMATTYGVDVTPGAVASFVSRGSNKHPVGAVVEVTTIAGHRDMSMTVCPGDAADAIVRNYLPSLVSARQPALAPTTTVPAPPSTEPPTTVTVPEESATARPPPAEPPPPDRSSGRPSALVPGSLIAAAGAAALGGVLYLRSRSGDRTSRTAAPPLKGFGPPGERSDSVSPLRSRRWEIEVSNDADADVSATTVVVPDATMLALAHVETSALERIIDECAHLVGTPEALVRRVLARVNRLEVADPRVDLAVLGSDGGIVLSSGVGWCVAGTSSGQSRIAPPSRSGRTGALRVDPSATVLLLMAEASEEDVNAALRRGTLQGWTGTGALAVPSRPVTVSASNPASSVEFDGVT